MYKMLKTGFWGAASASLLFLSRCGTDGPTPQDGGKWGGEKPPRFEVPDVQTLLPVVFAVVCVAALWLTLRQMNRMNVPVLNLR